MCGALLVSPLLFEPCLEPRQAFVPFGTNVVHPLLKLIERLRRQHITLFAPFLMHCNQTCSFKDCKMLENTLSRDRVFLRQLGRCLRAILRQIDKQTAAHWISKCNEDRLLMF